MGYPPRAPDFLTTEEELSEGGEQLSAEPAEDQGERMEDPSPEQAAQPLEQEPEASKSGFDQNLCRRYRLTLGPERLTG